MNGKINHNREILEKQRNIKKEGRKCSYAQYLRAASTETWDLEEQRNNEEKRT
jgi:hypothetical protein